jgi:acetate kinase
MESSCWQCLYKGMVDAIGLSNCTFNQQIKTPQIKNHHQALKFSLEMLVTKKVLKSLNEIKAVGHRVVHGGEKYRQATLITPKVQKVIKDLCELAPLHNPPNLAGIKSCQKLLAGIPQVAVFDTAFHQTMPEKAYLYALPLDYYKKLGIRRYGFHGTSHEYVSQETIKLLQKKSSKIVICHLGNGSSITAVINGKSVDTSMGLTPLEGVPMGTRSGDLDPAIVLHLLEQHNIKPEEVSTILNKKSGLLGLTGISSDVRTLYAKATNPKVKRAFQILTYRIAKYIGSYAAAMNGLDAITFTGGIGENAWYLRQDICDYFKFLGLELDPKKNKKNAQEISTNKSKIRVYVIPTNEEKQIAIETMTIISKI